jgi:hypothetical protein
MKLGTCMMCACNNSRSRCMTGDYVTIDLILSDVAGNPISKKDTYGHAVHFRPGPPRCRSPSNASFRRKLRPGRVYNNNNNNNNNALREF